LAKQIVFKFAKEIKDKSVLDVGCGTGRFVEFFSQRGGNVTGADTSENMLEKAKKKSPLATFVKADIFSLPFKDKTFDIVICSQVLTHLHSYKKPLLEMKRVLKDDGIIIIDVRNMLWPYRFPTLIKRIFKKSDEEYCPDYISIWKIKRICNKIGLNISDFNGAGLPAKRECLIEEQVKRSGGILKYIAPTLIIKIVKIK
jgi:ubiquinone/menaquinone biosynthesis C-methylase UbiE